MTVDFLGSVMYFYNISKIEKKSISERSGNYNCQARNKMFISSQTYEGIKITVNSIIEATQFLLQHQVKYVLTERFCQDPLENYFGRQRSIGAHKDNPTVKDFGYNDNTIRNQKVFQPIAAGNVEDSYDDLVDFQECNFLPKKKKVKK